MMNKNNGIMTRGDAIEIVDLIIADLSDRKGISGEWDMIEPEIQNEIRDAWVNIIMGE